MNRGGTGEGEGRERGGGKRGWSGELLWESLSISRFGLGRVVCGRVWGKKKEPCQQKRGESHREGRHVGRRKGQRTTELE